MHATVGIMYAFVWAYYYYVINYRNTMCIIFRGCDCPVIETRNHSGRDESVQKLQIYKKILRYSEVWNDLHKDSHAFEAARIIIIRLLHCEFWWRKGCRISHFHEQPT